MRVARLHGVKDVRIGAEPVPDAGAGGGAGLSLVRVTAVGLCGSDLHWYADGGIGDAALERPLVLGHEFAGVIEGGPRDGEPVAVDPAMPCLQCPQCHAGDRNLCAAVRFAGHRDVDGGLREYVAWPTALLHPLPSGLSGADGAMLEPLGVALHAVDLAHLRVGVTVGVFGCGPIGLLLVQLARVAGAATVLAADPLAHRRDAARRLGADHVWDPAGGEDLASSPGAALDQGADVAFEVAGTDAALQAAMTAVRPGARVILVGIPDNDTTTFPASLARRKGLTLVLSRRMREVYPRAIRLVEQGLIDVRSLVTAHYPLDRTADAFTAATARTGLKIIVDPSA